QETPPLRARVASIVPFALVAAACWGCGGDSEGPHIGVTVPVKGKVMYKGQPLTGGNIRFEPEDAGRAAHGAIKSDGTFELTTFNTGDGAVPGVHRFAVDASARAGKAALPQKFRSPSSSHVEVEVAADKTEYAIDLK